MMGRQRRDQGKMFYEFHLDDRIPKNHLLRRIDVFVTAALADFHKELEPYYSDIGRPSVDPELMIRICRGEQICCAVPQATASSLRPAARRKAVRSRLIGFSIGNRTLPSHMLIDQRA